MKTVSRICDETADVSHESKPSSWEGLLDGPSYEDLSDRRLYDFSRMMYPFFDDGGRCKVENEDRIEIVPSELINEGGEDTTCSRNGFD